MPQQNPAYPVPTPIYHITHLDNLEGILHKGGYSPTPKGPPHGKT